MKIVFSRDDLLLELFPEINDREADLERILTEFYTIGSAVPKVEVTDSLITVELDTSKIDREQGELQEVIALCENGRFREALPLADTMVKNYPDISDNHRILGQIHSELGDHEESINCLIDAQAREPKLIF